MHDVIVSGGGYNGISHGQRVSFFTIQVSDNIFKFRSTKIAMEGNAPRGTLLFRKGEIEWTHIE